MTATTKYFCRRTHKSGRVGWTGPVPLARAEREAQAWRDSTDSLGVRAWTAEVVEATSEVRREVRAWEKARKAEYGSQR